MFDLIYLFNSYYCLIFMENIPHYVNNKKRQRALFFNNTFIFLPATTPIVHIGPDTLLFQRTAKNSRELRVELALHSLYYAPEAPLVVSGRLYQRSDSINCSSSDLTMPDIMS